ncbi:MAG: DMT family transporter [Chloroflexota bacterium]
MSNYNISLVQVHIAVLLFGAAGLFGEWLELPSSVIVFGRVFFGALALLAILSVRRERILLRQASHYRGMLITGVVLAVHWVTFFQAIQVGGVAIGLISYSTFPIFVIFLDPMYKRNRIQSRDVVVAVITIIGAVLVVPAFDLENDVTRGFMWGLASSSSFALLSILNKISVADYSGLVVAFYQDAVAMVVLFPALFLTEYTHTWENVALLLLLGVVFTAIAHSLFIQGLREVRAQTASIIASLESVYGILFAFIFLGERPVPRTLLGGAIILAAAAYSSIRKNA